MSNEKNGAANAQKNAQQNEAATTKVRVLRDCAYGLVGEVATIPTELVAGAEASGMVDSHASAVAYAESLKRDSAAGEADAE